MIDMARDGMPMAYSDLSCAGPREAARLAAMGKQARDRLQIHLTPADRAAINALLEAIAPGLSSQRGAASEAALNMLRIGMAIYAAQPSKRLQVPHGPEVLQRAVADAKAREDAARSGDSAPPMTTGTFERAGGPKDLPPPAPPAQEDTPPATRRALVDYAEQEAPLVPPKARKKR